MIKNISFIGIDIGLNGAIAIIKSLVDEIDDISSFPIKIVEIYDMPKYNESYIENLNEIIKNIRKKHKNSYWMIEGIHSMPSDARKSAFKFGFLYGILLALLKANKINYNIVYPHVWKKNLMVDKRYLYNELHENNENEYNKIQKKNKKMFAIYRLKHYINESDFDKYIYLKKHHNRADSILIAIYGILDYLRKKNA